MNHAQYSTGRKAFVILASVSFGFFMSLTAGCKQEAVVSLPEVDMNQSSIDDEFEYAQVELSDPKVRVDKDGVCWFEVKYKFVSGKLGEHYQLTLDFPGTANACVKTIAGWQLGGAEGTIKDGIPLQEQPVSEYQFVFSEAQVPQDGYTPISNVLKGSGIAVDP